MEIPVRHALESDAEAICELVNAAYRPAPNNRGWTHEADLVEGERTSIELIRQLFRPRSSVLVLCHQSEIHACVHVEAVGANCHIGMLATKPQRQNLGLGKVMLEHAERHAIEHFGAATLHMSVLSSRPELLAFYERRGYALSGETAPYPTTAGVGIPMDENLHVLVLHKNCV